MVRRPESTEPDVTVVAASWRVTCTAPLPAVEAAAPAASSPAPTLIASASNSAGRTKRLMVCLEEALREGLECVTPRGYRGALVRSAS